MSFFPRTILLATDGSDEADLATAAAELSKATPQRYTSPMCCRPKRS